MNKPAELELDSVEMPASDATNSIVELDLLVPSGSKNEPLRVE